MNTVLITGANRGIGLEFVRQFANAGWKVHACCRNPIKAADLNKLAREKDILIHALDVTNHEQISSLGRKLGDAALDILINNAGTYGHRADFGALEYEEWNRVFAINTMAPLKVSEVFCDHLMRGSKKIIACITSKMGSINDNDSGGSYIYRSSKAALNAVVKSMAVDLAPRGITCLVLHPGWVKTDMGGPNALISTEKSVTGMRAVLENSQLSMTGSFIGYDGSRIPW